MKALTIWQPWAGLIACGLKDVENRKWLPDLAAGERFAIHAGKLIDPRGLEWLGHDRLCQQYGVILCTVRLAGVTQESSSEWARPGFWHWELEDVRRLRRRPRVRGRVGLWEWLDE